MTEYNDNFDELLGRQPTDAERQDLYRIRDALGIKNNDALWLLLVALRHYQTLYEKMPASIAKAANEAAADVKAAADAAANQSLQEGKAALMKAVASSANRVAHQVAGKVRAQWIFGCVVVVAVCVLGTGWFAFEAGKMSGLGLKHEHSKAMLWAITPEGKLAYKLDQAGKGNIKNLVGCEGKGWDRTEHEGRYACWPRGHNGNNPDGWWVP